MNLKSNAESDLKLLEDNDQIIILIKSDPTSLCIKIGVTKGLTNTSIA